MELLSILIPVYNRDCSGLISDLHAQAAASGIRFELIVADDRSTDIGTLDAVRATAAGLERCRLMELDRNIGRSAIRNLLADSASGDRLLFMDCDAAVCSPSYLTDYISVADRADVICGGARHPDKLPERGVELRWKYEKKADRRRSAEYRSLTPYARFTPFNFMISHEVFNRIRFSTDFTGYGYEDVLFGVELEKRGISVLHIDNPLLHLGIENNAAFLRKTEESIRNLKVHRADLQGGSALLDFYDRLGRLHLQSLLRASSCVLTKPIRRNLLGSTPSLVLFPLYKLLYLAQLTKGPSQPAGKSGSERNG